MKKEKRRVKRNSLFSRTIEHFKSGRSTERMLLLFKRNQEQKGKGGSPKRRYGKVRIKFIRARRKGDEGGKHEFGNAKGC